MLTPRRALFQVALSAFVVALLALTSPRAARTQDGKAVPADVRVVNPNTAPVFASVVNSASAPVQAKIVNALGTPIPANIINPATTPVQARIVNGPASPVQTSLVGQPTLGAKQSGTWNVGIANPVTSPVRTRDASDSGLLVTKQVSIGIPDGNDSAIAPFDIPLSSQQRLLIEHVAVRLTTAEAQPIVSCELVTTGAGGGAVFNAIHVPTQASAAGVSHYATSLATHIYQYPDSSVGPSLSARITRSGSANSSFGEVIIHGRILAVP